MQGSFFDIAKDGTGDDVYFLYGQGADISEMNDCGELPLGAAAAKGATEAVRALVELRAAPDEDDYEGHTPVEYAIWGKHYETLSALLEIGDDLAKQKRTTFAFLAAVEAGDAVLTARFLDNGVDVNAQQERSGETALDSHHKSLHSFRAQQERSGETALMITAGESIMTREAERLVVARLLLSRNADPNLRSRGGFTALNTAASEGYEQTAHLLIESGAHVEITDAVQLGDVQGTQRLLDMGAEVNVRDAFGGDTLLHLAAEKGSADVVDLLVKRGAEVDALNDYGRTALYSGVEHQQTDVVANLLNHNANVNLAFEDDGMTPLMKASEHNDAETVQMLIDAGAEINAANNFGYTALMIAAQKNALKAARILLKAGADVHRENIHLGTALGYAVNLGHDELAALLRAHGARLITE